MITGVVVGPSFQEAQEQIAEGIHTSDYFEFRLDRFDFSDIEKIRKLTTQVSLPVIFTFGEKIGEVEKYLSLSPSMIDLPHDTDEKILQKIPPQIKIITSYHNYANTPEDLDGILSSLKNSYATYYKIATLAQSSLDALRILKFLKDNQTDKLIAHCMGDLGQVTRILGPVFGSHMTYCSLGGTPSAPGQLDANTLKEKFHYKSLSPKTKVFALIGDPVSQSPADVTHNKVFRDSNIDAVYVKIPVKKEEVNDVMILSKQIGLEGFSVTIPLKEEVLNLIDIYTDDSEKMGAVNTLHLKKERIFARNTDAAGALDGIEKIRSIQGKRVVIVGAGGTAKAIAFEAKKRGANICILNRTPEKAKELADSLGGEWGGLEDHAKFAEKGYDVIINATAALKTDLPFVQDLLSNAVAMDVNYHSDRFLGAAKERGCQTVTGYEMFALQALKQFTFWFGGSYEEHYETLLCQTRNT